MPKTRKTYVTLHKNFVRENIPYTDKTTGEDRTFNSVTLPKGVVIDGKDVGYYKFNPLFVNASRDGGEDYRDIPLLTNREVWLKHLVLDCNGRPVLDDLGKPVRDVVKVMPEQLKEAVERERAEYQQHLANRAGFSCNRTSDSMTGIIDDCQSVGKSEFLEGWAS